MDQYDVLSEIILALLKLSGSFLAAISLMQI